MKLNLKLLFHVTAIYFIITPVLLIQAQVQIGNTITASSENDGMGDAVSISDEGDRILIGIDKKSINNLEAAGEVKAYELKNGQWLQLGQTLEGKSADQLYGNIVEIAPNGKRIAIGDHFQVSVFDLVDDNWIQVGTSITVPGLPDHGTIQQIEFSADGNTIAFSGSSADKTIGIYEWRDNSWKLKGDFFPNSLRTVFGLTGDGSRIVVLSGLYEVVVFDFENGSWKQTGNAIKPPNGYRTTEGLDIARNGSRVILGLDNLDNSGNGAIGIYDFVNGQWILQTDLIHTWFHSRWGQSLKVDHSGDQFVIATAEDGDNQEISYAALYKFDDGEWEMIGDRLINQSNDDQAQQHVDITTNGSKIVMGGNRLTTNDDVGFVKVFDYSALISHATFDDSEEFSIFPNPANDVLYINAPQFQDVFFCVYDIKGEIIITNSSIPTKMDISTLEPGIYFMEIRYKNTRKQTRFVKIMGI